RRAVLRLEEEELGFGTGVERVPFGRSERNDFFQSAWRVAAELLTVGRVDVGDHPRHIFGRRAGPWENAEGGEVGPEVHVRLFNSDEALDGRSVEHDLAIERFFELAIGDLDVLDGAQDVGELQAHELDLLALGALEDLRLRFTGS